jgi:putative PIN family toxin of toxin-antitoxin system
VRAVVDTSVWVGAFRSRRATSGAQLVLDACLQGHVRLVLSREVLHENIEVLLRPDLALDAVDVLAFGLFLARHADVVAITGTPQGCRDANDDIFLESARLGTAEVLVTLDRDMLAEDLVERLAAENIRVLSIGALIVELRAGGIIVGDAVVPRTSA